LYAYCTHLKGEFLVERVNFHLTDGERKGLEMISEVTGIKKAELIRRAIDEYIERKKWAGVTGLEQLKEIYA
jgi:predicted DNA-binding protein